jgi:hypothetical protein
MDPILERVRRFWAGEGRCVASLTPGQTFRPRQDLTDEEYLAAWRRGLTEQASLPGLNLPSVYPDFGTVSVPKYWGGRVVVSAENGNPFLEPAARTLAAALTRTPRPVDDPALDAARAIRLYRQLGAPVWLRTPDLQGPLNTAAMILDQEELLVSMASEPEPVRELLDRISDLILAYWRWLRHQCGDRLCGNIWPYTALPSDLGITLTEDLMPLLSVEMYAKFGIPVLQKISRAAGGLQIHCCGEWGRHAATLAAADLPLRAVEFHYPFTRIEELEPLAGRTVFVPYIALDKQTRFRRATEYWRHLLANTDRRFRYWFAACEDTAEMRDFVREFTA